MANALWGKFFLGFGIVTVISGIYLVFQGDYLMGISGSMVGALLIYQHLNKPKDTERK